MSLSAVILAMQNAILADLETANAASPLGAPWMIIAGEELATDLSNVLGQASGVVVALYPLKPKRDVRYLNSFYAVTAPSVGLIATISGNSVTFSGSVTALLNIHALIASGPKAFSTKDALVQTTNGDTLSSVATKVAAAITALGYTATASGDTVTLSSGVLQYVNVGGAGSISEESNRISQMIQASVYAPNPDLRNAFSAGMMNGLLGSTASPFLNLPDGSAAFVKNVGANWLEPAQMSYSLYQACVTYQVEYMVENVSAATQIGAVQTTQVVANNAPVTLFAGGQ